MRLANKKHLFHDLKKEVKVNRQSYFPGITLLAAILLPTALTAQITITSSDIVRPTGSWARWGTADDSLYAVDPGSTGGPQNWDFTSYDTPNTELEEVVELSTTPFVSDFPTANYCKRSSDEGSSEDDYQYMRIVSTLLEIVGMGIDTPDTSFSFAYDPTLQVPLPVSMGSSWSWGLTMVDTVMGIPIMDVESSHWSVDAFGTVSAPGGTYAALRAVSYDTSLYIVGEPPSQSSDTTATISYHWLASDPLDIVEIESADGETNPNFTTAQMVRVTTGHGLGIGDGGGHAKIPLAFQLSQNTPNPFNPRTDITFTVPDGVGGTAELSVFTLRGEKVRAIISGPRAPGTYTVSWDGRNDRGETLPSGIYLYRLTSGGESMTRKMVMAK